MPGGNAEILTVQNTIDIRMDGRRTESRLRRYTEVILFHVHIYEERASQIGPL